MSWREFHLRKIGFERSEKRAWYKVREMGYAALIGGGVDPKKLSKDKYMPLDAPNSHHVTQDGFAALKEAQQKYLEQTNGRT